MFSAADRRLSRRRLTIFCSSPTATPPSSHGPAEEGSGLLREVAWDERESKAVKRAQLASKAEQTSAPSGATGPPDTLMPPASAEDQI